MSCLQWHKQQLAGSGSRLARHPHHKCQQQHSGPTQRRPALPLAVRGHHICCIWHTADSKVAGPITFVWVSAAASASGARGDLSTASTLGTCCLFSNNTPLYPDQACTLKTVLEHHSPKSMAQIPTKMPHRPEDPPSSPSPPPPMLLATSSHLKLSASSPKPPAAGPWPPKPLLNPVSGSLNPPKVPGASMVPAAPPASAAAPASAPVDSSSSGRQNVVWES